MCVCVCVLGEGERGGLSWVQVTPNVTLKNVTPSNNLLLNAYFENPTVGLHVPYGVNLHTNFHAN